MKKMAIQLLDDDYSRAHQAFSMAASALSMGYGVIFFASGRGVVALFRRWTRLRESAQDAMYQEKGVVGFEELREMAVVLGLEMLACETGLTLFDQPSEDLLPQVKRCGMAYFLSQVDHAKILTY